MKATFHLLVTAAILLSSCNGQSPDSAANDELASATPDEQAMFCAFDAKDTKEWTGKVNADRSVTVEGKAYSSDPKYKATLFQHEIDGSVARVFLSKAENKGEAPTDGWWPVSRTIPDDGSIQTVEVWCDRDTKFDTIPVRRDGEAAAPGQGRPGENVEFKGCPRIIKNDLEKPDGCMVVRTATNDGTIETYNIDSAQPRPDPNRLIIVGTGIYHPDTVDVCQAGKVLADVKWQYTKSKCPLGEAKQ